MGFNSGLKGLKCSGRFKFLFLRKFSIIRGELSFGEYSKIILILGEYSVENILNLYPNKMSLN